MYSWSSGRRQGSSWPVREQRTLRVLGSSLKLGCWRKNASTSEGGSSMIGDAHLTPQPPRETERRPGRKQISRSRKCSKMAAVMALAVLPRRMTRWSQWAYAGRAQFCAVRRSVFGFSVRSGEKGSDLGAVDAPFFSAHSGLLRVLYWERVGHMCC